jgi:fibronectin type 3 domain-containing protein
MSSFSNMASQTIENSKKGETSSKCQWVGTVEMTEEVDDWIDTFVGTVRYEFEWNTPQLPNGIYFYQIQAGDFKDSKKIILLR